MSSMTEVLVGLIKRTQEGKLKWRTSADEEEFVVAIDTIAVVISRLGRSSVLGSDRHKLEILNDLGVTVESIETQAELGITPLGINPIQQNKELSQLYTLARRSALDTDSTIEKLAKSLENFR